MSNPTALQLLATALTEQGYEGLYNPGLCSCPTDDISPMDCLCRECRPGYLVSCMCGECCEFHIGLPGAGSDAVES